MKIPHLFADPHATFCSRRDFLQRTGSGAGLLGLATLLGDSGLLGSSAHAAAGAINPLAPKESHFPAKAKSVIWLFMNGGPSQVDTWDYKPELMKRDGQELKGFDIVIVFAKPDAETVERIKNLATGGATVVAVDAHGKYSWQSSQPVQLNEHTTSYSVGNGKVLELAAPVSDPETFAQDIRRLLGKRNALLSLWNGLTTIAVPYKDRGARMTLLELVNYAGDPLRLQVQVKGSFTMIRYETPEHGCCESLEPVRHDGFTEFVIPEIRIAGRVHLESQ